MRIKKPTDHIGRPMAELNISLHSRATQIEITVPQAKILRYRSLLSNLKRRSYCFIEHANFTGSHLNRSRG